MFSTTKDEFYDELTKLDKHLKQMQIAGLEHNIEPDFMFQLCQTRAYIAIAQEDLINNGHCQLHEIFNDNEKASFWRSEKDAIRKWKKEPTQEMQNVSSQPRGR